MREQGLKGGASYTGRLIRHEFWLSRRFAPLILHFTNSFTRNWLLVLVYNIVMYVVPHRLAALITHLSVLTAQKVISATYWKIEATLMF